MSELPIACCMLCTKEKELVMFIDPRVLKDGSLHGICQDCLDLYNGAYSRDAQREKALRELEALYRTLPEEIKKDVLEYAEYLKWRREK